MATNFHSKTHVFPFLEFLLQMSLHYFSFFFKVRLKREQKLLCGSPRGPSVASVIKQLQAITAEKLSYGCSETDQIKTA